MRNNAFIFIDYQNQPIDFFILLKKLEEKYKINGIKAYWDWSKMNKILINRYYSLGVELINIPENGFSNEKRNDVKLVVDCIETMFNHPYIDTFVLVTGDLDFFPLITKLKEYGKNIVIVAREKSISEKIKNLSDLFIPYNKLAKLENYEDEDTESFYLKVIEYLKENRKEINIPNISKIVQNINLKNSKIDTDMGATVQNIYKYYIKNNDNTSILPKKENLYIESYEHFLIRKLTEFGREGLEYNKLKEYLNEIQVWSPHTNMSFRGFINKLKNENKLLEKRKNVYCINPKFSWKLMLANSNKYKDFKDEVLKEFYKKITQNKEVTLNDIIEDLINIAPKKILRFILTLVKFTGLLYGPENSDYVTFNIPVYLKKGISLDEIKKETDKVLIKKLIKVYPLSNEEFGDLIGYIFGNKKDIKLAKEEIEELIEDEEIKYIDGIYYYNNTINSSSKTNIQTNDNKEESGEIKIEFFNEKGRN